MEKWSAEIDKIIDIYNIIDEFEYKLDREVIRSKQEMQYLPKRTLQMLQKRN